MLQFFTICSNNYLSQALSLRQSLSKYYPNNELKIVLADINSCNVSNAIEIKDIITDDLLQELIERYNIIEFNTAIKPFVFHYFFQQGTDKVIYLDPDILFFNRMDDIIHSLDQYSFVLTPHITELINNKDIYHLLLGTINTGTFNLGFLGLSNNKEVDKFIDWWCSHMTEYGHNNIVNGQFYDQKLFNLIPAISTNYKIINDVGCNIAEWNLHERALSSANDNYYVNSTPLKFFHFSNIKITNVESNINSNPLLKRMDSSVLRELLELYISGNIKNDYTKYKTIVPYYQFAPNIHRASRIEIFKYKLTKLWHGRK